ncbi:hypothetical protein TNCV_1887371 [Trichonephila clavipes]|nr:hypothetical protein TNCV_1887371 [Trichonephila clavipes]
MDVCKCIVLLQQGEGDTLNSRRAASPVLRLVEREEMWEVPDSSSVCFLKIGVEPSQIVLPPAWCSKLPLTTYVQLALSRDEFHGT